MEKSPANNPVWSSGLAFALAAIGASVGLGNIWKFPYITGVSGGGAFVLVYLLCVLFVAIPILVGELLLGRRGHGSPPEAMHRVATEAGRSPRWALLGWLGLVIGSLIATYYSVIAGWTLAYIVEALKGFDGGADPAETFTALLASPGRMILWHSVFMISALLIVSGGLQAGIERAVKILMPALFILLLVMVAYASVAGDFGAAVDFLFRVDFSKIDGQVVLAAISQAFFSIGVGMGLMMAYGAYVPRNISLVRSAFIIAGADTGVALLAGLMIFPLVFANGLDPAEGPGLVFITMPTAFAAMPGGSFFGLMFFVLLSFAAVTSIISIIEPAVAYASGRWAWRRSKSCLVFGFGIWALGLATVFSFNIWAGFMPLDAISVFAGKTLFDLMDFFTLSLMTPISGILIAVFVGWRLTSSRLREELQIADAWPFKLWFLLIRFVAPLATVGVLVSGLQ